MLIPDEVITEAAGDAKTAGLVKSKIEALAIRSDDDRIKAGRFVAELRRQITDLDKRRKAITKPIDQAKKQVMDLFRPAQEALQEASTILERALRQYDEDKRRAETLALEAARDEVDPVKARELVVAASAGPVDDGALTTVVTLDFEITDPAAVPREYCAPVPALIRQQVQAGNTSIPGVRVFEKTSYRRR